MALPRTKIMLGDDGDFELARQWINETVKRSLTKIHTTNDTHFLCKMLPTICQRAARWGFRGISVMRCTSDECGATIAMEDVAKAVISAAMTAPSWGLGPDDVLRENTIFVLNDNSQNLGIIWDPAREGEVVKPDSSVSHEAIHGVYSVDLSKPFHAMPHSILADRASPDAVVAAGVIPPHENNLQATCMTTCAFFEDMYGKALDSIQQDMMSLLKAATKVEAGFEVELPNPFAVVQAPTWYMNKHFVTVSKKWEVVLRVALHASGLTAKSTSVNLLGDRWTFSVLSVVEDGSGESKSVGDE